MTDTTNTCAKTGEGAVEVAAKAIWERNNQRLIDIGWSGAPRASFNDATQEQRDHARTIARAVIEALTDPRALTAGEEAVAAHCQLCGGRVEGWFCQTCEAEFHEEGGLLVLKSEAQPARMPTREEVAAEMWNASRERANAEGEDDAGP